MCIYFDTIQFAMRFSTAWLFVKVKPQVIHIFRPVLVLDSRRTWRQPDLQTVSFQCDPPSLVFSSFVDGRKSNLRGFCSSRCTYIFSFHGGKSLYFCSRVCLCLFFVTIPTTKMWLLVRLQPSRSERSAQTSFQSFCRQNCDRATMLMSHFLTSFGNECFR